MHTITTLSQGKKATTAQCIFRKKNLLLTRYTSFSRLLFQVNLFLYTLFFYKELEAEKGSKNKEFVRNRLK